MNDHISIGRNNYTVTPMNPWEAMEVIFIMQPYIEAYDSQEDGASKIDAVLSAINARNPWDFIRLLSLMLHVDAAQLVDPEAEGAQTYQAFTAGLAANRFDSLMLFGQSLGILKVVAVRAD